MCVPWVKVILVFTNAIGDALTNSYLYITLHWGKVISFTNIYQLKLNKFKVFCRGLFVRFYYQFLLINPWASKYLFFASDNYMVQLHKRLYNIYSAAALINIYSMHEIMLISYAQSRSHKGKEFVAPYNNIWFYSTTSDNLLTCRILIHESM